MQFSLYKHVIRMGLLSVLTQFEVDAENKAIFGLKTLNMSAKHQ